MAHGPSSDSGKFAAMIEAAYGGFEEAARAFSWEGTQSFAERVAEAARKAVPALEALSVALGQIQNPTLQAPLLARMSELAAAISTGDVKQVVALSAAIFSEATAKGASESSMMQLMTPEQKKEYLWGEINKLNKEIGEGIDEWLTDAERKQRDLLLEAIKNAKTDEERLAAQRRYDALISGVLDREDEKTKQMPEGEERDARTQKSKELQEKMDKNKGFTSILEKLEAEKKAAEKQQGNDGHSR